MVTDGVAGPHLWLGETIGFWIQTAILGISAAAGVGTIRAAKNQEKRRATVDLVLEQKRDQSLKDSWQLLTKIHESGEVNLAKYLENLDSEVCIAIMRILNMHEFVAAGIREGAFDEETYKRVRYTTLRKDWNALCGFVMEIRRKRGSSTLFQEFQWLNDRWANHPLKADDSSLDIT